MPRDFLAETIRLIRACPRHVSMKQIAEAGDISPSQLHNIITGKTANPGVVTIERIYKFVTEQNAKV